MVCAEKLDHGGPQVLLEGLPDCVGGLVIPADHEIDDGDTVLGPGR